MKSYRIVIEYTDAHPDVRPTPDYWDWWDLLAQGEDEAVSFIKYEEIETPAGHVEQLQDTSDVWLDELAEIAQEQDMGYPNAVGPSRFTVCVNCGTQILKKDAFVTTQGDVVCGECADSTI
jgi:hypothetical protein